MNARYLHPLCRRGYHASQLGVLLAAATYALKQDLRLRATRAVVPGESWVADEVLPFLVIKGV
jgi:hypothetical protein